LIFPAAVGTGFRGGEARSLLRLLKTYPAERMEAYPVRPAVNKVQNEGPELLEPAA
jgi:putative SOS response-associated peptidase YedK